MPDVGSQVGIFNDVETTEVIDSFRRMHGSFGFRASADPGQNVTVSENVQIPGANLKPGTYKFSVEDGLVDRAVIRISNM